MSEELPKTTEVYRIVYVGAEDGNRNALVFKAPEEGRSFNRVLGIDDDTGASSYIGSEDEPVPHRELEPGDSGFSSEKYGHTWHYAK